MIISLNGYMGSGKDTVGRMIQWLTSEHIREIWLDDLELYLQEAHKYPDNDVKWQIKKFGYKLKEIASILTGIPVEKFEDQEFKKSFLPSEWSTYYNKPHFVISDQEIIEDKMTVRHLLQVLGTNAIRNKVHQNAWVNALMSEYKTIEEDSNGYIETNFPVGRVKWKPNPFWEENLYPNWIISDCRFENEAKAVKQRGGIVVRIDRGVVTDTSSMHISETSLDNWDFDYRIKNNAGIPELLEEVKTFIKLFKIA